MKFRKAEALKKWEVIKNVHAIPTAAIPVIKAEVDLDLLRATEESLGWTDAEFYQLPREEQASKKSRWCLPEEIRMLKIDITFDDNRSQSEEDKDDVILMASGDSAPR